MYMQSLQVWTPGERIIYRQVAEMQSVNLGSLCTMHHSVLRGAAVLFRVPLMLCAA